MVGIRSGVKPAGIAVGAGSTAMTQLGKKIRERWFLDAFIRQNSLALHVMAEREQPDFECEFEGRIIGLEVTELFHPVNGSALQKRFVTSRKIVRDAYRLYIDFKLPPVQVTVLFSPGHSLQLVHRISLSQRLAELIAQSYPSETPLRLETSKVAPDLYPAVLTVFIRAIPYESMAHWDVGRAGWVARLNNDALEPVISTSPHFQ